MFGMFTDFYPPSVILLLMKQLPSVHSNHYGIVPVSVVVSLVCCSLMLHSVPFNAFSKEIRCMQ